MSEQLAVGADSGLRQFLQDPVALPAPRRRWDAAALRGALALLQPVQVTAGGFATGVALVPVDGPGAWETFGLASLVAALAALLRRDFGYGGAGRDHAPSRAAATVLAAAGVMAVVLLLALPHASAQRDQLLLWVAAWAGLSAALAAGLEFAVQRMPAGLQAGEHILLLGSPDRTERAARLLAGAPEARWQVAGRVDGDAAVPRIQQLVEAQRIDTVLLLLDAAEDAARIEQLLERLADQRLRICLALDLPVRGVAPLAMVELAAPPLAGWPAALKRCADVVLSLLLLLGLAPVMGLAALAIVLESPGPVLFRQWRFGAGSRPFRIMKFRTMRVEESDPTGARRTARADPRVTRIGRILRRSSVDELPQLLNVLRGEMSLVGPRPHPLHMRVGETYYFEAVEHYRARHAVRPGLTGWAQINGSRGEVDTLAKARRRIDLDLWYIENWSLQLDLKIMLRTALGGFASPSAD